MFIYWLMFLLPAFAVLFWQPHDRSKLLLFMMGLSSFYVVIVGLRFEVGCDWHSYLMHFYYADNVTRYSDWQYVSKDIGYAFLNIFVADLGGNVIAVNLLAAVISFLGLYAFAKRQPLPLLVYVVAVPYIIIVLFQGYTRQAVAFGFELFALVALAQARNRKFVLYIILAATFHKTAVILLPLAALASSRNKWWSYFWVGLVFVAAYVFFLAEKQDALWEIYVVRNMASSGGGIRVALNVLPSAIFLLFIKSFSFNTESEKKLWFWFAILSLVCIPLVSISSTAVDRIALYLMPMQLYVFSRLPLLSGEMKGMITAGVIVLYFAVQFVWLNFATHAVCWVPYQSALFN